MGFFPLAKTTRGGSVTLSSRETLTPRRWELGDDARLGIQLVLPPVPSLPAHAQHVIRSAGLVLGLVALHGNVKLGKAQVNESTPRGILCQYEV